MINFLQIFKEENGQWSGTRIVTVICPLLIVGVWTHLCLRTGTFLDIPAGVVAALAIFLGSKVVQKFTEHKNGPTSVGQSESGDDTPAAV